MFVERIDDEPVTLADLSQARHGGVVFGRQTLDLHDTVFVRRQVLAELGRRHVAKELQFGDLADALDLLGRHLGNKCLQIVGNVVEDFLVRVEAPVALVGIR